MALTNKNMVLLDNILLGKSNTQAAKDAGYSHKTAYSIAHELLKKPEAKEYLAQRKAERLERTNIDADDLLIQLQDMRIADYADILDPDSGEYLPVKDWPLVWRQMIASVDVVELFEGRGEEREKIGNVHKIKFMPRDKIMKMFGDHVNIQGFQKTEVHVHQHLHQSAERIRAGRGRARQIATDRNDEAIEADFVPVEEIEALPNSEKLAEMERRRGVARDFSGSHTPGDGR